MIDRKLMRSLLENMEKAAEETLQHDATFYQALRTLRFEIDNDPMVQATVRELQAVGCSVFKSFVPHIKIRVRTEEGVFALPKHAEVTVGPPVEKVARLTQELRNAASHVIRNSPHYFQLDNIVNQAVGSNPCFERIAAQIESAGYEVLICLDLSAYAQVQGMAAPCRREQATAESPIPMHLSGTDVSFLKGLGISVEGSQGQG
jgi:hypothetical protein